MNESLETSPLASPVGTGDNECMSALTMRRAPSARHAVLLSDGSEIQIDGLDANDDGCPAAPDQPVDVVQNVLRGTRAAVHTTV